MAYRAKRGSFNVGRRIECSTALLALLDERYRGRDVKMHDFMPHEDEPAASFEDIAKALGAHVR